MTPDLLRKIITFLTARVSIGGEKADSPLRIVFDTPDLAAMIDSGFDEEVSKSILDASWWNEMVTDIIETPDFCEPDDPPEQMLIYARDVVADYLRKRVVI